MLWPAHWWIFPLACLVMMVVMFVFMAGAGGMRRMPRMRRTDELDVRHDAGQECCGSGRRSR